MISALIAPQIIHYQQIVSHPRVVELAESGDPQAEDLMRTLNLFNHGTIEDYRVEEHKYKPLRKDFLFCLRILVVTDIKCAIFLKSAKFSRIRKITDVIAHDFIDEE